MFTTSFEETCASGTAKLLHGRPAAARTDHASASRSIESGGGDNVLAAAGVHGCYRMLVCGTAHVPKVIRPKRASALSNRSNSAQDLWEARSTGQPARRVRRAAAEYTEAP